MKSSCWFLINYALNCIYDIKMIIFVICKFQVGETISQYDPMTEIVCGIDSTHDRATYLASLYTQTKSRDHENLKALENHAKPVVCEIRVHFCNWWALKLSVKWKWTMLRDCNMLYRQHKIIQHIHSPGPHHGNIIFIGANYNPIACHGPY